ncbi:MAG: DNA gyrase modulator, partial [Thermoproteota archaeon]
MFEDLALRALNEGMRLGASYVEVRCQEGVTTSLRVRKGVVEASNISTFKGMGIRVLKEGSWGFACSEDLTLEKVIEAANSAVKLALSSSGSRSRKVKVAEVNPAKDKVETRVIRVPSEVSIKEKLGIVFDADKAVWSKSENIVDDSVIYADYSGKKVLLTSEGT